MRATLTTFFEVADVSSMAAAQRELRKQVGERLLTIAMVAVSQAAEKGKRTDGINAALEKISLRAQKASEARTVDPLASRSVTIASTAVGGVQVAGSHSDDELEGTTRTAATPCRVLKQSGSLLLVKPSPYANKTMGAPVVGGTKLRAPVAAGGADPAADVEVNKLMSQSLTTPSVSFLPEGSLTDTTFAGATVGATMAMGAAQGIAVGGKSPVTKEVRGYSDILDRLNDLNAERIDLESKAEAYRSTMYKYEGLLPVQPGSPKKARRRPGSSNGSTKSPLSHGMSHSAVSPGAPLRRKARRAGW